MNTLEFLKLVLPPVGEYYLLSGREQLKTTTAGTIEGLGTLVEAAKSKQKNVFVGLAGFRPGTDRKKPNVVGKKCFYIDLDVGDDPKKYPSKQDAFLGLKEFLTASGFPAPSLIIDSGGGLHAYWLTDEVVVETEWTSLAQGLKQLCAKHGLKHDVAVCADSARILRVPGTFNWKDPSTPRECKVIKNTNRSYSVSHLRTFLPKESNVVPLKPGVFDGAGTFGDVIATTASQPRYMKHILNECGVAKHTHETHGRDDDYNQWFSMLTLLLFCEDGDGFVHPFSNGHPDYSAATVTAKWRSRQADKEINAVHGATTCETFHALHPEICEACPHWNSPDRGVNWSSPLHFGLPPAENDLPFPYIELSTGNTGKRSISPDGEVEIVHAFDGIAKQFTVYDFGAHGIAVEWTHTLPGGRSIKVSATSEELVDQRAFNKSVAATLIVDDRGAKEVRTMAQAWAKQIQARRGEIKAPGAFGWVVDGKKVGFRLGDVVYWSDGVEQGVAPSRMDMISSHGSYAEWQRMVQSFMRAEHIESEVILAAAFAAPLMAMSHVEGAILSAVSLQSGTGKTTAMRMGQAVWGNPSHAMFSLSDTANSIFYKMGKYNNLPAMWDDLRIPDTKREARATVDMIYQITQGREKSRLTSSVDLRGTNTWKTLLICSSNTGLSPYIELVDQGGSAAQHRMLEFDVSPLDARKCCDPSEFNDLNVHYGHAGVLYVKWVLANYDACKALFQKNRNAIQDALKAKPEDRFTVAAITAVYTAAQIAGQAGIVQFNKAGILKFLIQAFKKRRVEIADISNDVGGQNSLVELLAVFMLEHQLNTVWMKRFPKPGPMASDMTNLIKPADREALAAIAVEDGEIRINKTVLDHWARGKGRVAIGRQMIAVPGISTGRKNVTSHIVGAGSAAPYCYSIRNVPETAMLFSEIPNCGGNKSE